MLIVQAQAMGMCFGVEDALKLAHSLEKPEQITILGEIVHNRQVQDQLIERGFRSQPENQRERLPDTPAVLITAHGISHQLRDRLKHKEVIDTTCPLVTRVHQQARKWAEQNFRLILVGKPGHVEVLGITEDYPETVVIPSLEKVPTGLGPRLAVLAQTTTPPDQFQRVAEKVRLLHPHSQVQVIDTVCKPTRQRQQAILQLLDRIDALVVVGGPNSNNTLRLVEQAQKKGLPSVRVEGPEGLSLDWFEGIRVVGLSAGTSTPRAAIEAVHRRLLQIARAQRKQVLPGERRGA